MSYLYSPSADAFFVYGLHLEIPVDVVEVTDERYRELADARAAGKIIIVDAAGQPQAVDRPPPSFDRDAACVQTDAAVAAIYARFTRFQPEYEKRESQAIAFRDAGYAGDVPEQVAAFATPAGLTPQAATDRILQQAAQLRSALDQLGVQRMRKYEVLREVDDAVAQAALADILAQVSAIGASLE